MSQSGLYTPVGGSSHGPIMTIDGDVGYVSAATVTFTTIGSGPTQGTALFIGSNPVMTLTFSDAHNNLGLGNNALAGLTSGTSNVCFGLNAGTAVTSGASNTVVGVDAGEGIITGSNNVIVGASSLTTTGDITGNIAVGKGISTGSGFTGSNNIFLGLAVGAGTYTSTESGNILIGHSVTGTVGESSKTHIANIYGTTTASASRIMTADSTGLLGTAAALTNGQLLIGSSSASPVAANITSTGGTITITNGAGSINIDTTYPEAVAWSNINASTVALVAGHGYDVTYSSGGVTATLPSTAAQYTVIRISVGTSQIVSIAENSGQQIQYGNRITTATSGGLASTAVGDSLELLCTTANTTWRVLSSQGNWTVS